MSSAVDEDTARAINSGRETIGALLSGAQEHLQKVFIVFLIGFVSSFLRAPRGRLGLPRGDREGADERGDRRLDRHHHANAVRGDPLTGQDRDDHGRRRRDSRIALFSRKAIRRRGYHSVVPISKGYIAGFVVMALSLFVAGSSTPTPSSSRTRSASSRGTPSAPASNPVTGSPSSPSSWRC